MTSQWPCFLLGAALVVPACADRPTETGTTPPTGRGQPPPAEVLTVPPLPGRPPEALARGFARALKNPAFRAYIKAQLDASPFTEHKLQFQTFLGANGGRALRQIAQENGVAEADLSAAAAATQSLEFYFPVKGQRAAWPEGGDLNVLVATALGDKDAPVAFDPDGHRQELSPVAPPGTPVIALVPQETDFTRPAALQCYDTCPPGGGGGTNAAGLYMTQAHFVQSFESWLKGDPEFEIHILGQLGQTDSLTDYQCAGEQAGGPYAFDQNGLDWTGSVLLFSQDQLYQYKLKHPNMGIRVFALEDDDTACQIKTNHDDFVAILRVVDSAYQNYTGGRDTLIAPKVNLFDAWTVGRKFWTTIASWIKTNDDLIGNAVEDKIVGAFYPGYNWFIKGGNNVTNGWINLEMRQ